MNNQRDFIIEICEAENITVESLSKNYVLRLTKGEIVRTVYGSFWDINNAAADKIACDKCACYAILNESGVPAIEHRLLSHPIRRFGFTGESGVWEKALSFFNKHRTVVVKPNSGSNGRALHLCDTIQTLELAVQEIFETSLDVAISPFYKIKTEYRIFYLNGECHLIYGKSPSPDDWRHNLSQGATAFEIMDEKQELESLAKGAAKAIGITFASVDIAELEDGKILIMEINSGVQARQMLQQLPHLRNKVKTIYATAIRDMF